MLLFLLCFHLQGINNATTTYNNYKIFSEFTNFLKISLITCYAVTKKQQKSREISTTYHIFGNERSSSPPGLVVTLQLLLIEIFVGKKYIYFMPV